MTGDPKFSVIIPYKQRLANLRLALSALADQTMDRSGFEVVVGAMEYSTEYVSLCQEFSDRLTITSVLSAADWSTSLARNLALRQATGQVALFMDADMALPTRFLRSLYDRYFAHGQRVCVLGQTIGYDDVVETDIDAVATAPYGHYRELLADLEQTGDVQCDVRWTSAYASAFARFPWAFTRSGLVALTMTAIREHDLVFDIGFLGWGPEDQEWALRVARTGTPIVLGEEVYGLHLPHRRDVSDNGGHAWVNNRYYLGKWPRLELEVALGFGGWLAADCIYPEIEHELAQAKARHGHGFGVVRGTADDRTILAVGAFVDGDRYVPTAATAALFDTRFPLDVLPLVGFSLPYADRSVDECHILPPAMRLGEPYREVIFREAERVSRKLCPAPDDDRR